MSVAFEKEVESCPGLASRTSVAAAWDRLGLATSVACVIHCLATPLMLVLLPAMGSWLASPLVHQFLAVGVVAAAAGSLAPGVWQHGQWSVLIPAVIGIAAVMFAAFGSACCGPQAMHFAGLPVGSHLSIVGGLCLIAAHANNWRICCPTAPPRPSRAAAGSDSRNLRS